MMVRPLITRPLRVARSAATVRRWPLFQRFNQAMAGMVSVYDLTRAIFGEFPAPFANLAALKSDATYGDGFLAYNAGANFTEFQYVLLEDSTLAHYNTDAWIAGAAG